MSYQGWSNRTTWAAALWINNDQGLQDMVIDMVRKTRDEETTLAWELKEFFGDLYDSVFDRADASKELRDMIRDIGDEDSIDFRELAASFWEDFKDQRRDHEEEEV